MLRHGANKKHQMLNVFLPPSKITIQHPGRRASIPAVKHESENDVKCAFF